MSTDWKLDATEAGVAAESIAEILTVMLLGRYGLWSYGNGRQGGWFLCVNTP
jgi:hypothetical protein